MRRGLESSALDTRSGMPALLVVQALLLITLVPLAQATSPDPLWMTGIYP